MTQPSGDSYASEYCGLNRGWVTTHQTLDDLLWQSTFLPPWPRLFWSLVARDYFLRAAF